MTRGRWLADAGLAALVAVLGLVEVWLPMESVMGDGSPVVSTLGILWFAGHLSQRRARPWVALAGLLVWPVLGTVQGGAMQVLFFGQLVPVMVLVYSLARHGRGRIRWVGPVCGAVFVTVADLFIPLLQSPNELIFHWGVLTLSFLVGHALRVSEDRAGREAVRAHAAEAEARERALTAVSEERARIARELHDIVAHSVGTIVVQAGAAEQVVEEDPAFARQALGTIRTTGSSALAEMRRLVSVLRDPDLGADFAPQPGLASLPDLVERAGEAGLEVRLRVSGDRGALPTGVDLAAYRIVQEALTNVRRHSAATCADVSLDLGAEVLLIEVSDGGPARERTGPPGHGLLGMRERAALYGGRVRAAPEGPGFAVRAELPLERV
ncbi:sensor histidine kinase [Ornithinimicrobium cerasi]|uniref:sensor histidine kinase n=1 Tax=Ornithinimicrobium cerasi TaxID=2248773 RepID=UPI001F392179|nr:sensor histidine kinase [Ornithinimicrobium cerasi]